MCCKQIFQPKNFQISTISNNFLRLTHQEWSNGSHFQGGIFCSIYLLTFMQTYFLHYSIFQRIFILTDNGNSHSSLLPLLQCFLVMMKLELFCQVPIKILVEKWYIFCYVYELIWEILKFLHYSILLIVSNWLKCSFHFFRIYIYWVPTMCQILL